MERLSSIFTQDKEVKGELEEQWTDPLFAHDSTVTQKIEGTFKWIRASQIFDNRETLYASFSGNDFEQGILDDSYLFLALAMLTEDPKRIQKLFIQEKKSQAGCYTVVLYIDGKRVEVVLDDYFPVKEDDKPAFIGSKGKELWAMLIEKAWAKIHGGYSNIEGGSIIEALAALTGAPIECVKHKSPLTGDLWELLKNSSRKNQIICATASADTQGILNKLTYNVIKVKECLHNNEKVKLIKLRVPWGNAEWSGKWNEDDVNWTTELRDKFYPAKGNGSFVMEFKDYAEVFENTFIAKVNYSYVHFNISVQKLKALVAFQVSNKIKGFLSGHQIAERLEKGYNTNKLNVELYNLEDTPKLVKGGNNNSLGTVDLEIELEPGLYILKGELDEASKIPLITFSGYTNTHISFVELNVEDLKEVDEELLNKALENLNCAYTSRAKLKKGQYPGAFRNCLNGHKLKLSTSLDKSENIYRCENCCLTRKIVEGRWKCNQCEYNICTVCRLRNYGNIMHKADDKSIIIVMCNKRHTMEFLPPVDTKNIHLCDKCGKAYYGMVSRWRCEECDRDLCRECMAPPQDFKSKDEILSIETCPNNHNLNFITTETGNGFFECYLCTKIGNAHNGRWACIQCGVNICYSCKPSKQAKDGMLSVKTKTLVCDKDHLLLFGCPRTEGEILCKICEKGIEDKWRWTCDCGYDVCINCRAKPEGRKEDVCCNMHKLGYSNSAKDCSTYGKCWRCNRVFELTSGRYCCLPCEYECCKNCLVPLVVKKPIEEEITVVERTHNKRPQKPVEEKVTIEESPANKPLTSEEPIRKESHDEGLLEGGSKKKLSHDQQDTLQFEKSGKKPVQEDMVTPDEHASTSRENCGCSII